MSMHSIQKNLHTVLVETCGSTMDVAKDIVCTQDSLDQIVCVMAKEQTAGRGRGGSVWLQEKKELQTIDFLPMTLIFPKSKIKVPPEWITSCVGCAVFDTLKKVENFVKSSSTDSLQTETHSKIYIKWPNDVLCLLDGAYKKISGILCENVSSKNGKQDYYLVGIGLNLFSAPPLEKAASFWQCLFKSTESKSKTFQKNFENDAYRQTLIQTCTETLFQEIQEYLCYQRSVEQLKNLLLERSLPIGTPLSVHKGAVSGAFLGVNDHGALILEGQDEPLYSADVVAEDPMSTIQTKFQKPILAIDFGNSRIHAMGLSTKHRIQSLHIEYDSLLPVSLRPLIAHFNHDQDKEILILFTSVIRPEKTRGSLEKIKGFLRQSYSKMSFHDIQVTEENIFSSIQMSGDFEKDRLGADRALKFFFAFQEAKKAQKNVLVVSFGTALTCEGVSFDGMILENLVAPGIQMSFKAMHHYTALLPELTPNPDQFSPKGKHWDQQVYMQRGVFFSAAATVLQLLQMHKPCACYLSGGNADQISTIIKHMSPQKNDQTDLHVLQNIEAQTLIQYAEKFSSFRKQTPVKHGDQSAVLKTMIKPRLLKKEERNVAPRLDDFRRIGARIESNTQGTRIDSYLGSKFAFHSRETWYDRIVNGEVLIEHNSLKNRDILEKPKLHRVKPTYKIKEQDQIWLFHPPEYEPDVIESMDVIFDDGDLCVFAKPPNMVVHASGIYGRNTFVHLAQKMGYGDCAPVHRIDRETSGILACARKSATRSLISDAFQKSLIKKMYIAVTKSGRPLPDQFRVSLPIGEPEHSLIRLKLWVNGKNPQPAETYFVKLSSHDDYHLFLCLPKTGRTNQIRIHLAAIGHWIVGDKMYHENEQVFIEFYEKGYTQWVEQHVLAPRHLLHNSGIMAPLLNYDALSAKAIVCPLPKDFVDFPVMNALLTKAHISQDAQEQKQTLEELFLKWHAFDFMECLEIDVMQ